MAAYAVLFPVRPRVLERYSREQVELAARIAFWQHPPDDCVIPEQQPELEWMDDLLASGSMVIRVSGDVTPPADPPAEPGGLPIRTTKLSDLRRGRVAQ